MHTKSINLPNFVPTKKIPKTQLVDSPYGLNVISFDRSISFTVFDNEDMQVFYTKKGHFLFVREQGKIIKMKVEAWIKMILQIQATLKESIVIGPVVIPDQVLNKNIWFSKIHSFFQNKL